MSSAEVKGPPFGSPYGSIIGYWLIGGDPSKGQRWCEAQSRTRAQTIYRNIDPTGRGRRTRNGAELHLAGFSLSLAEHQEYWAKRPYLPSEAHTYTSASYDEIPRIAV